MSLTLIQCLYIQNINPHLSPTHNFQNLGSKHSWLTTELNEEREEDGIGR